MFFVTLFSTRGNFSSNFSLSLVCELLGRTDQCLNIEGAQTINAKKEEKVEEVKSVENFNTREKQPRSSSHLSF